MSAKKTPLERLEAFYIPEPNSGCWLWLGFLNRDGYGRFHYEGHQRQAHRISYILHGGTVPDGLELDHKCKVRCCVNPAHLEAVSHAENVARSRPFIRHNSRKTHCKRGHPFDESNTYWVKWRHKTMRQCLKCKWLWLENKRAAA